MRVHVYLNLCALIHDYVTTLQMSHKGAFSEKDKIVVGLLFLYPELVFVAANNGMHVCLLDCLTQLIIWINVFA